MTSNTEVATKREYRNLTAGLIVLGALSTVSGLVGTVWIGLSGLVWRPWEFGTTYHWDSESDIGIGLGVMSYAVTAVVLLWLVVWGVRTWSTQTAASQAFTALMPIISVVLIAVGWVMLMSPANGQPTWGL